MTRVFQNGKSVAVTVVDVKDCVISLKDAKSLELGYGKKRGSKVSLGKYSALGYVPKHTKVLNIADEALKAGDKVESNVFGAGEVVTINAISKGKGFAGVVKRHGFAGGPKTHGQSDRWRAPGSIGAGTTPGRVLKGKRMAGRMGSESITIKNKKIIDIMDNYLLLSGPVPGNNGDLVLIYSENK